MMSNGVGVWLDGEMEVGMEKSTKAAHAPGDHSARSGSREVLVGEQMRFEGDKRDGATVINRSVGTCNGGSKTNGGHPPGGPQRSREQEW